MFLNMPSRNSKNGCKNRVLGEVYGNAIMLFGHTRKQYDERLGQFVKLTGINELKYKNICYEAEEAIKRNFLKCLVRNDEERRDHSVKMHVNVVTENGYFILDVIMLVKSTFVTYWYGKGYKNEPAPEYKKYAEKGGLLELGNKVISLETCVARVRLANEIDNSPISEIGPSILDMDLGTVEMTNEQFKHATRFLMQEKTKDGFNLGYTKAALQQIKARPQVTIEMLARHCNNRKLRS